MITAVGDLFAEYAARRGGSTPSKPGDMSTDRLTSAPGSAQRPNDASQCRCWLPLAPHALHRSFDASGHVPVGFARCRLTLSRRLTPPPPPPTLRRTHAPAGSVMSPISNWSRATSHVASPRDVSSDLSKLHDLWQRTKRDLRERSEELADLKASTARVQTDARLSKVHARLVTNGCRS